MTKNTELVKLNQEVVATQLRLQTKNSTLDTEYKQLDSKYRQLDIKNNTLDTEYKQLNAKYKNLEKENHDLKTQLATTASLIDKNKFDDLVEKLNTIVTTINESLKNISDKLLVLI